jgi:hypothetical protein
MNIETEVKFVIRNEGSFEGKAKQIMKFTNFREEDIIKSLKMGGKSSEVYGNLIKLDKIRK